MWEQIFQMAIGNGIWAALFVALLVFELRDSNKREKKYQDTISKLSDNLSVVNDIKEEVQEVKTIVLNKKLKRVENSL